MRNRGLLGICRLLSDAAELYRAWAGPGAREVNRDVASEHKGLLDAAFAHDADLAVTLFEAHIDRTKAILAESPGPPAVMGRAVLSCRLNGARRQGARINPDFKPRTAL